ncbi:rRNA methyltransferase 3, mitochondrial-like isoform X2 [Artemia franciscana]|uniref:RNA 2-O ribose methyltransferase substrate binding domain-containing protein n=1 Tax=Artemia franciscana TaxID=6661 RepID=A0AA88HKY7_ARTSF|nr:hypothetical protein QYM36_011032 [Artemia franciscana]
MLTMIILMNSLLSSFETRKFREKKKLIYLEGRRLIEEALTSGIVPTTIFHTKPEYIEDLKLPKETQVLRIRFNDLKLWSNLENPQGIVGFFKQPEKQFQPKDPYPLSVICDNVRDPSNMGAIIRTVAGAGCEMLYSTKGCVDIWNSKTLRAGSGGHFKIPLLSSLQWHDIENLIPADSKVYVAISNVNNLPVGIPVVSYHETTNEPRSTIIMGGETEGVSDEALEFVKSRNGRAVHIPLRNNVESLSVAVAAGVLLFHLTSFCKENK